MSPTTRWEYIDAVYPRYRAARRRERQRMLDEVCAVTGYHRKYAVRILNAPARRAPHSRRRQRKATYDTPVIDALRAIWTAAGYPWSVLREEDSSWT